MGIKPKIYCSVLLAVLLFGCRLSAQTTDTARYFYPGGKISSEGLLINGKPEGFWRNWYESGQLKSEGFLKAGLADSSWKFFNADGSLSSEISYKNGKKEGIRKTYINGVLVAEESFIEDKKEGYSLQFDENGRERLRIPFKNGVEQGRGVELNAEGAVISLFDYTNGVLQRQQVVNRFDRSGKKTGLWVDLFPDLSTQREIQYSVGLKNGYLKEYDVRGNLVRIEKYKDDILIRNAEELARPELKTVYDKEGNAKSRGSYLNGKPVGLHVYFDSLDGTFPAVIFESGFKIAEGRVDALNRRQGIWKEYYSDGNLRSEGAYLDDLKVELWKYYFQKGTMEQTGKYLAGKPVGIWRWFYEDGVLRREESYRNGKEDGLSVEFSPESDTVAFGAFIEGERDGEWFFREGDQTMKGKFTDGQLDGLWQHRYLENGKLSFSGTFQQGIATGLHQAYYFDGTLKWHGKYEGGKREGLWRSYASDGSLYLTIEYKEGVEIKYEGVKILPEFERADFENLLEHNFYVF